MVERKKILLFDDDYESMQPLKLFLETALGFDVELTASMELFGRLGSERFDLICIDLMIHPDSLGADGNAVKNVHFENVNWRKTGIELLRLLRQGKFYTEGCLGTSPQVPIIILSAIANYSVEAEIGDEIEVQGYIEKPFALAEIVEKINRFL